MKYEHFIKECLIYSTKPIFLTTIWLCYNKTFWNINKWSWKICRFYTELTSLTQHIMKRKTAFFQFQYKVKSLVLKQKYFKRLTSSPSSLTHAYADSDWRKSWHKVISSDLNMDVILSYNDSLLLFQKLWSR